MLAAGPRVTYAALAADGSFVLNGLLPGAYDVSVTEAFLAEHAWLRPGPLSLMTATSVGLGKQSVAVTIPASGEAPPLSLQAPR